MSEQIEAGEGWRLIDIEKDTPEKGDDFWSSKQSFTDNS